MDFENILQQVISFGQSHMPVVWVAAAVLVVLTIFKTKSMMKFYGFCALVLVVIYLVSLLGGALFSGVSQKDRMINKTREVIGD